MSGGTTRFTHPVPTDPLAQKPALRVSLLPEGGYVRTEFTVRSCRRGPPVVFATGGLLVLEHLDVDDVRTPSGRNQGSLRATNRPGAPT